MLQCPHHDTISVWTRSLKSLEQWMTRNQGHPELIELIILGLSKWHDQHIFPYDYDILEPTLIQAYKQQQ
jgi:hypothetical protein